ncbi:gag-proteinase polyprotein [Cucumis melo var. makuwa]|uniref:Gag-proteinase polyprotein n=1 Tax=Cucumis melo var. makuwa TaxID=1194695 RepID=A0A5D3CW16_CUCMM|nr:gag-proteinase polyprotein [Cucumis melo var. makuwa]TYK14606.1 gag-proteinase polyprotein [Cucumis melo var. makuwa]
MSEDETVANYNERVMEIANESFNLGKEILEYKIVRKVLRSLPGKFDMKVIAIQETHDITTLKLDELFESLLNFEMTISNREDKKGKGIAFKSIYEEESADNKLASEANVNESTTLVTKKFSKVVKRFRNMNSTGSNTRNSITFRRRDGESYYRRDSENLNRRDGDNFRRRDGEGRTFKCRECDGFGHYQPECPMFFRK